jgi:ubiquinone/menaquinone biosynthesis C-methylase UbiE
MADEQAVNTSFVGSVPDNYERYLGPLMYKPYAQDLACRLLVGDHAQVLELACGTGILTSELLSVLEPTVHLVATDLNEPMLAVAQAKIRDRRVEWQQADVHSLPFDSGRFEAVVCQLGIQFFTDKVAAAAEVRRVLRPGGVFLFSTWGWPQENPLAHIAQQTAQACFPGDTPTFYQVPWSYGDTRQIESDLRAGGFRHVSIQPVSLVGRAPSADYAAMGVVQGTPMANAITERRSITVDAFTAVISASLTRELGDGPLALPMQAWIVRAS